MVKVVPTFQFSSKRNSVLWYLAEVFKEFLCDKLRNRSLGLASVGVIFMPSIVKVGTLVYAHTHTHTSAHARARTHTHTHINTRPRHGNFTNLISVLRKGKEAKFW